MIQRLLSVFHARNLEFIRDRGTMIFVLRAADSDDRRHELRVRRQGAAALQGRRRLTQVVR